MKRNKREGSDFSAQNVDPSVPKALLFSFPSGEGVAQLA